MGWVDRGGEMVATDLTREELFVLVWEKPASEVAAELGFSDVALGKFCKRLQVPKPPRGYWAEAQMASAGPGELIFKLLEFKEKVFSCDGGLWNLGEFLNRQRETFLSNFLRAYQQKNGTFTNKSAV